MPPSSTGDEDAGLRVPFSIDGPALHLESSFELFGWGGWTTALSEFFGGLAASWDGWSGERQWTDDGTNHTIRASHDGKGTAILIVERSSPPNGLLANGWSGRFAVAVDAGQLAEVARGVDRLISARTEMGSTIQGDG